MPLRNCIKLAKPENGGEPMASLKDVLNKFKAVKGIELAAVVSIDGMQLDSFSRSNLDVDSVCAVATTSLQMGSALGHETGRGDAQQVLLDYTGGIILLDTLNAETMLLVVSSDPDSIGKVRFMTRRYREDLLKVLDGE
jgi:predicted regulator of Ras-like GTPase activity (Roadblock/LC7/MglB family)